MIKVNEFKYSENGIIYPSNRTPPDFLYKYYPLSNYSIDAFLNGYLFASHPFQLNDIKDSRHSLFTFKYKPPKELYEQLNHVHLFEKDKTGELLKKYFWKTQSILMGVVSLTTSETNDLMWPHYTNETGFLIKFNTKKLLKSLQEHNDFKTFTFTPVNYVKRVCQASIIPTLENLQAANYYMVNVKNQLWKYEDEWRIFVSRIGMHPPFNHYYYRDYKYPSFPECIESRKLRYNLTDCIEGVIWGNEFIATIGNNEERNLKGWADFTLNKEHEEEFKLLLKVEKEFKERFYISTLREDPTKNNVFRKIWSTYRNKVEELSIERFSMKYDIKINDRTVYVRPN